jgi:hypothetical protein
MRFLPCLSFLFSTLWVSDLVQARHIESGVLRRDDLDVTAPSCSVSLYFPWSPTLGTDYGFSVDLLD